jgi:anti-sigma factor RsiW
MKKTCEEFRSQIVDFADGVLAVADRPGLKEHLESCPGCAENLRTLSDMKKIVQKISVPVDEDPFLEGRILARVRENLEKYGSRRLRLSPVFIPIFAAVLVLAGVLFSGISGNQASMKARLVNYEVIDRFLVTERDTVSSYVVQPTAEKRYNLATRFYDYLESLYGSVDEKSFKASYGYMESNLAGLI